jgi:glycosyltransferase involved in cell wall biosynthesis
MTSYNHEVYLGEAIESVLSQTFDDFELIIIDDASQDDSRNIIESYAQKNPRIKPIFHDRNSGIARSWNEGVRTANGHYIAIAASDDLWLSSKLEKQIEILKQDENLIVWSDAYIIDAHGEKMEQLFTQYYKAENRLKNGNLFEELLWGNFICPQSLIFKKEIAQEIGFDNRYDYAIDYKFLLSVSRKYNFHFIAEPLVKYRMHGQNAIFRGKDTWEKDMLKIFSEVIKQNDKILPGKLKARLHSRMGKYLLGRKKYRLSRHQFLTAFKYEPSNMSYLRRFFRTFSVFHSNRNRKSK